MEPEERGPEETPALNETTPPEETPAEGWYFDIPEGAWERQEAKNRDLRNLIRSNLKSPSDKRPETPPIPDRTPAWVHDPEPERTWSDSHADAADATPADIAEERDSWSAPPPPRTEHHLDRPAAHRQEFAADPPSAKNVPPEPPKYGTWDVPARDADFETRALKPSRRVDPPAPVDPPADDASGADASPEETDVVEGMRQWALGSGRTSSTERPSTRWDEMMNTPADSGSLIEGMRQWATTQPDAGASPQRRRLDDDPDERADMPEFEDAPVVFAVPETEAVADAEVESAPVAAIPAWGAAAGDEPGDISDFLEPQDEESIPAPSPRKRGFLSRLFGRKADEKAAAAARLAASEAAYKSPWGEEEEADSWQAAATPEEPSEWTLGQAEIEELSRAHRPEPAPEEPTTTWLTAPDAAPQQQWSGQTSAKLGIPAAFQPPKPDENGGWERPAPAEDEDDSDSVWAAEVSERSGTELATASLPASETVPAADAGAEPETSTWDWDSAFPTGDTAAASAASVPADEAAEEAPDEEDDPWADFLATRQAAQRLPNEPVAAVEAAAPAEFEAPAEIEVPAEAEPELPPAFESAIAPVASEEASADAWEAVMAASGYDDADTPLVAETYTDALPAAAPGPEPGAEAAPRVPSESWISEEDRDWGPSPKTDPAGLWASASDDNVVLRAFEAHASTEIDEDLPSADGDGVPDFSRPSFRSLLGDDADELVEDDEILTDDHPSLSRLQGWAPQREVASVANADPAWALGANRPPSDPSRPDPDPFAEGEGAPTPPWEGDQAAAGEHGARKASRSKTLVRELVETGLLALLVFLSVRASFQNFKVDGISMQPTLEDGQFLIVNKLVYSEVDLDKLSSFVPFVNPGSDPERNVFHAPERGDIIVLRDPHKPDVDLIKRVIGLPGETVEIRDGHVYINDQLLIEPYIKTAWSDNKPKVTIPADEYYVLGDNRGNSLDSRSQQVGLIRKDLIIGKAMLSYWPRNKFGLAPNGSPSLEEKPTLSTQRIDD